MGLEKDLGSIQSFIGPGSSYTLGPLSPKAFESSNGSPTFTSQKVTWDPSFINYVASMGYWNTFPKWTVFKLRTHTLKVHKDSQGTQGYEYI